MPSDKRIPLPVFSEDDKLSFWKYVDKRGPDECWPWMGGTSRGYGRWLFSGRRFGANRIAFFLDTGKDPGIDLVCHSCDNPPCCNPKHLSADNQSGNMMDCSAKGRLGLDKKSGDLHWARLHPELIPTGERHWSTRLSVDRLPHGEAHHLAKLTDDIVKEIRDRHRKGVSSYRMSKEYPVSKQAILAIVRRETWKHIE